VSTHAEIGKWLLFTGFTTQYMKGCIVDVDAALMKGGGWSWLSTL